MPIQQMFLGAGGGFTAGTYTGTRGVFGGGSAQFAQWDTNANNLMYITIQSTGNSSDFGNLTQGRQTGICASNGSRGCFMGGWRKYYVGGNVGSNILNGQNTIDYVTFANTGNATDFGNLSNSESGGSAGASNGDRGVRAAGMYREISGYGSGDTMDYISIATTGNASDLADTQDRRHRWKGASDGIYGYYCGGRKTTAYYGTAGPYNTIMWHNIATTADTTTFGSYVPAFSDETCGCGTESRLLYAGGIQQFSNENNSWLEKIDYLTAATTGNSTDFGNMTGRRGYAAAMCDQNRAVIAGGSYAQGQTYDNYPSGTKMDYVTVATTGNASNFGNVQSSAWNSGHDSYLGQSRMGAGTGT